MNRHTGRALGLITMACIGLGAGCQFGAEANLRTPTTTPATTTTVQSTQDRERGQFLQSARSELEAIDIEIDRLDNRLRTVTGTIRQQYAHRVDTLRDERDRIEDTVDRIERTVTSTWTASRESVSSTLSTLRENLANLTQSIPTR